LVSSNHKKYRNDLKNIISRTNTLAYFAPLSVTKKKKFYIIDFRISLEQGPTL